MDDDDLEELERELPALSRVRRFARSLEGIPWFANLGEKLTPGATAVAQAYLDGLGFPEAEIAILADWEDAAGAAESCDWHSPAWEAEELLRADLTGRALGLLSQEAVTVAMAMIAGRIVQPAEEGIEQAASLWDLEDDTFARAGIGAAVQSAHQAALVLIAAADPAFEAESHPFVAKFRLFEFGRWPIGVIGRSFSLF